MDTLHRNFNLFHHQVPHASTWRNWRRASLHHTWREDTSPNSQLQLIKDRSQPCSIQYCEQLKVTKECFLIILICLRIGVPCFLAGFGRGSTSLDFVTRQAGWWQHILDRSNIFGISNNLIIERLFGKRNIIKAFLGLDNAGKTSLVQFLSTGVVHQVFLTPIENDNSHLSQSKQRNVYVLWMMIT